MPPDDRRPPRPPANRPRPQAPRGSYPQSGAGDRSPRDRDRDRDRGPRRVTADTRGPQGGRPDTRPQRNDTRTSRPDSGSTRPTRPYNRAPREAASGTEGRSAGLGALRPGEMKVYGVNACKALFERRAQDIIRAYVATPKMKDFGTLLKWCAANKKAYHVLTDPELEKVSSSVHHEGVVLVAKQPLRLSDSDLKARLATLPAKCALVWLDGVGNPHNVGAILRLMSHFGAPLVLGRQGELPQLTPALARIAEGGIEHVTFASMTHPTDALAELKAAGFKIFVATATADQGLFHAALPARCVFVLGNESYGVSPMLAKAADGELAIPGTGAVESLNVSHAAALVLGEYWRRHHGKA